MQIIHTIEELRRVRRALPGRVGLVPTMGFLHDGHLALMREAGRLADTVIASVFVNPKQFGEGEDFESYPRDLEADAAKAASAGCDILFAPTPAQMYPDGFLTTVSVAVMTENLCGPTRPDHFAGVTTVVTKLFLITEPDVAVFGQKDYQQLAVLGRMTRDLNIDVEVVGYPTVREPDGLAMSSRNKYLTEEDRPRATLLSDSLVGAWRAWRDGERDGEALVALVTSYFDGVPGTRVDYIEAVHPETLEDFVGDNRMISDEVGCVVAMAVYVGKARLLDNARLDRPLPPLLAAKEER